MTDNLPSDSPWWARWLVAEWRDAWKWLSTWLITIAAAAPMLYENISGVKAILAPRYFHWLESALVLLIFLTHIKKKPNNNGPTSAPPAAPQPSSTPGVPGIPKGPPL